MKKLNLGCGEKIIDGYTNVDVRPLPGVDVIADLSRTPWSWADETVSEVVMLDFLEHFPHADTDRILNEVWRVMEPRALFVVQVPDLEHCCRAASLTGPYLCNRCGWEFPAVDLRANFFMCGSCDQPYDDITAAAVKRLFGGQDYPGNFHYSGFSKILLRRKLEKAGFGEIEEVERNENGETYFANWNFKFLARKLSNPWGAG